MKPFLKLKNQNLILFRKNEINNFLQRLHSFLIYKKKFNRYVYNFDKNFRVIGFEPMTPCSQNRCATKLRYTLTSCNILFF